jgi:hypothetical protein
MASIHLPCGCHINDAFVLGMCPKHYAELRMKQHEEDEANREFQRKFTLTFPLSAGAKHG